MPSCRALRSPIVALALAAAALVAPAAALAGPIQEVGPSDPEHAYVDVNNHSQVVGTVYHNTYPSAVLWDGHGEAPLPLPAGFDSAFATSINDSGQIAGAVASDNDERAVVWSSAGVPTVLPQVPLESGQSVFSDGMAINANGDVVGNAAWWDPSNQSTLQPRQPVFWPHGGTPVDINGSATTEGYAFDVNASDTVLAMACDSKGFYANSFLWDKGKTTPVPLEFGQGNGNAFGPSCTGGDAFTNHMNDSGLVVGDANVNGTPEAATWQNGTTKMLPGGGDALAVNNLGDIVGQQAGHTVLWPHGSSDEVVDLQSRLPLGEANHWSLGLPVAINDLGQVLGMGSHDGKGVFYLLSLDPVFSVDNPRIAAPKKGTAYAVFHVTSNVPVSTETKVAFRTIDGAGQEDAKSPADYQATTGDVTFKPGQDDRTVVVQINPNPAAEHDKDFQLEITPEQGFVAKPRGTATIVNRQLAVSLDGAQLEGDAFLLSLKAKNVTGHRISQLHFQAPDITSGDGAKAAPLVTASNAPSALAAGASTELLYSYLPTTDGHLLASTKVTGLTPHGWHVTESNEARIGVKDRRPAETDLEIALMGGWITGVGQGRAGLQHFDQKVANEAGAAARLGDANATERLHAAANGKPANYYAGMSDPPLEHTGHGTRRVSFTDMLIAEHKGELNGTLKFIRSEAGKGWRSGLNTTTFGGYELYVQTTDLIQNSDQAQLVQGARWLFHDAPASVRRTGQGYLQYIETHTPQQAAADGYNAIPKITTEFGDRVIGLANSKANELKSDVQAYGQEFHDHPLEAEEKWAERRAYAQCALATFIGGFLINPEAGGAEGVLKAGASAEEAVAAQTEGALGAPINAPPPGEDVPIDQLAPKSARDQIEAELRKGEARIKQDTGIDVELGVQMGRFPKKGAEHIDGGISIPKPEWAKAKSMNAAQVELTDVNKNWEEQVAFPNPKDTKLAELTDGLADGHPDRVRYEKAQRGLQDQWDFLHGKAPQRGDYASQQEFEDAQRLYENITEMKKAAQPGGADFYEGIGEGRVKVHVELELDHVKDNGRDVIVPRVKEQYTEPANPRPLSSRVYQVKDGKAIGKDGRVVNPNVDKAPTLGSDWDGVGTVVRKKGGAPLTPNQSDRLWSKGQVETSIALSKSPYTSGHGLSLNANDSTAATARRFAIQYGLGHLPPNLSAAQQADIERRFGLQPGELTERIMRGTKALTITGSGSSLEYVTPP